MRTTNELEELAKVNNAGEWIELARKYWKNIKEGGFYK